MELERQDDTNFVIEKILDQHLVYEQKTIDALTALVRVVFVLNAGALVLLVVYLGAASENTDLLARFRPGSSDAMDFFMGGAVFAILSGLFSWWAYGSIAQRKRAMLEDVFLRDDPKGRNRTRSERLIDAVLSEGRARAPSAAYFSIACALIAVGAFILGCKDTVVSFSG